jgi:hypothetical protein
MVSRDKRQANLVWHTGNLYAPGDMPTSPTFSRWAGECTEALEDAYLIAVLKLHVSSMLYAMLSSNSDPCQVGTIRWPLSLHKDAADLGYFKDDIQMALYNAYSSVFDILTGQQQHPIKDLLSAHMANRQKKSNEANSNHDSTYDDMFDPTLDFKFPVPILPGDASLADEFISNLKCHIGQLSASLAKDDDIISIGQALFHIVILRTYLSRPAESDHDIFELVRDGRVSRIWTNHEQALAACYGENDTSPNASFSTRPDPLLWDIKIVMDPELEPLHDRPLVAIHGPVVWTTTPGLTGGALKPRCYRPPHLCLPKSGPRPKPRPAYRRRPAGEEDVPTYMTPSIGVKRPSNMMADAETPAAKTGKANSVVLYHGMQQDHAMEGSDQLEGASTKIQRGQRQRKPVKF